MLILKVIFSLMKKHKRPTAIVVTILALLYLVLRLSGLIPADIQVIVALLAHYLGFLIAY